MFKPNRIGTPLIHQLSSVYRTTAFTPNVQNFGLQEVYGNVINAASLADFGESKLTFNGSPVTIAAGGRSALIHQFIITQPLEGDACGVELNASLDIYTTEGVTMTPFFAKLLSGGAGAVLDAVQTDGGATRFGQSFFGQSSSPGTWKTLNYREQVVVQASPASSITGVYGHGFMLYNNTAGVFNITNFTMTASVRQLNDQQDVDYRDTAR